MPPKRKTPSNIMEGSISKRHTLPSGPILVGNQTLATTITSSPAKSKPPIRTYGKGQRNIVTYNSLEENEGQGSLGKAAKESRSLRGVDESSEDELDLTRSSESPQKVIKIPVLLSDDDLPVGKRGTTGVILDIETLTPTREGVKRINVRSAKATKKPSYPVGEPTPPALARKPQTSQKATISPSTRLTKSPKFQTETTDGPIWSVNPASALVSNIKPRRTTRASPIKSSVHMLAIHRPTKEQEIVPEKLTSLEPPGRLSKRVLEQGCESPSLRPSLKKQKLMFDVDVTSPPPKAMSHSASHALSKISLHTNLTMKPTSDLLLVNTRLRKSPLKQSPPRHPTHMHIPEILPLHLYSCLNAQKRALLRTLQRPFNLRSGREEDKDEEGDDGTELGTNEVALQQLHYLLSGTVDRGEGNSCLILGPRGSGKTRLVEQCLSNMPVKPIVLRLSGWTQHSDRLAIREIAHQLNRQTGTNILVHPDNASGNIDTGRPDHESNPFLDKPTSSMPMSSASLPPSSHLSALISILPTLPRPTVVILDGFDLFSLHPRQSLLYCLLDTAQSCRASTNSRGLAIVGITTRVDTINQLEKRVKSRFSGRILRTAPAQKLENWVKFTRAALMSNVIDTSQEEDHNEEWKSLWNMAVEGFLGDRAVINALNETFSVTRDIRMLNKILVSLALHLTPSSPFPSASRIMTTVLSQRTRPRLPSLHTLSYPALCLLIASVHVDTAGHSTFTFEMLHECFYDQVRASTSAPVQVNGGSIGMVRCSREVVMSAFEYLVSVKTFVCIAPSTNVGKEFVKYRSVVAREDVKRAVDKTGQINLRKWFTKAQ